MTDWNEIGDEVDHLYRPYLWLGEEQDAHVTEYRQMEVQHRAGATWALEQAQVAEMMQSQYNGYLNLANDVNASQTALRMQIAAMQETARSPHANFAQALWYGPYIGLIRPR